MSERRQEAVRPAGSPMVSRERPSWAPQTEETPSTGTVGGEAVEKAREAGGQLLDDSRERARAEVDNRSTWAGERVMGIAGDVRDVAGDLRARGKDQPARLAEDAALRIERFGDYLRESDSDRILADARDLGRRQPALIVAGAAVIGIAAGRLVRASEPSDRRRIGHG
ncbi:MAG: hypothetical protein JHC74_09640 [Thermoleophilia bacterium]|nr:hypothetical protein [Thermoleophilia bacterium]